MRHRSARESESTADSGDSTDSNEHPTVSTVRSILATLLWIFQFGYSCTLMWQQIRSEYRLARRKGCFATSKRCGSALWALLRGRLKGQPPPATQLHATDFARLPVHLAFALDPTQLKPTGKVRTAAALVGATEKHAAATVSVAGLLRTCLQLPLPEITLFDDADVLSQCWPSIGVELAQLLSQSEEHDPSLILVLQGASNVQPHAHVYSHFTRATPNTLVTISTGEVLLVHRGLFAVVKADIFLSDNTTESEANIDDDQADYFVDTSRPGVALSPPPQRKVQKHAAAASSSSGSAEDASNRWRARIARFVSSRMRTDRIGAGLPAAASVPFTSVRLISILGHAHSQSALAAAVLTVDAQTADPINSSSILSTPSAVPSQALRTHLQRSILPLPLSEPDLLLSVSSVHEHGERSLHAFPPWLLRVTEIGFPSNIEELTRGEQLEEQLHHFARTIQRSGT
jgi:hypothetical protein